jgi:hypothetical protein
MTKEVLKLALECAERCESIDGIDWSDTIDAIKEALALPEQGSLSNGFWVVEAVDTVLNAWPLSQEALLKIALGTEDVSLIPHKPELPEQEPVAWMHKIECDPYDRNNFTAYYKRTPGYFMVYYKRMPGYCIPLYASPPKREWVGLTDEQIRLDAHNADSGDWNNDHYQKFWHDGFKEGARGAEAMLKEKNT